MGWRLVCVVNGAVSRQGFACRSAGAVLLVRRVWTDRHAHHVPARRRHAWRRVWGVFLCVINIPYEGKFGGGDSHERTFFLLSDSHMSSACPCCDCHVGFSPCFFSRYTSKIGLQLGADVCFVACRLACMCAECRMLSADAFHARVLHMLCSRACACVSMCMGGLS